MTTDRFAQTADAINDAKDRGWEYIGNNTVRRSRQHDTPAHVIDYGWWTGQVYSSSEFLAFVWHGRERVPTVLYTTARTYWTPRERDGQKISFKKALEILASDTSEIHENHYVDKPQKEEKG